MEVNGLPVPSGSIVGTPEPQKSYSTGTGEKNNLVLGTFAPGKELSIKPLRVSAYAYDLPRRLEFGYDQSGELLPEHAFLEEMNLEKIRGIARDVMALCGVKL